MEQLHCITMRIDLVVIVKLVKRQLFKEIEQL